MKHRNPLILIVLLLWGVAGCGGGDSGDGQSYSISGTVSSAPYMVVDGDVNDTNTIPVSNDSFDEAQSIPSSSTVSGYVNVAGAGETGNSKDKGDPEDYFQVELSKGTVINLVMVESSSENALILYLYDDQQSLVDAGFCDSSNKTTTLIVTNEGTYFIRVQAVSDSYVNTATRYALSLGQSDASSLSTATRLSDEFVSGEVLVRFEEKSAAVAIAGNANGPSAMGLITRAGAAGRDRLIRPTRGIGKNTLYENLGVRKAIDRSLFPGTVDEKKAAKLETLWMIRALRNQDGVQFAEPNFIRRPLTVPNDYYYDYQWHYPLINLPDAWDITTGSEEVVVAVVDTGVLFDHPDLEGQLLDGYDFISDPDIALDGDGVDTDPSDPGDRDDVQGSSFHGTHIAGTIAAATNNNTGVAGIAWSARIEPLRVLGYGGGTSYDIIQAVKYAAGLATDYDGVQRDTAVDVINMSLGGNGYSQAEQNVYTAVREQGVIIVAAAGNGGNSDKVYPAAYEGVVSVSAVTIDKTLASYSSYGETIDLTAPGGSSTDTNGDGYVDGILSTIGDDSSGSIAMGYAFSLGTSMAVPHVSGVIALMKSVYPSMTPDEFDALLQGGYLTQDLGDAGRDDQFGYGLIDAQNAVLIAKQANESGTIPAILSASPNTIDFSSDATSAEVTVENTGNESQSLIVSDFTSDSNWLDVEASEDVDAKGLGTYTVSVDRSGLADGTYTGTITFESTENQAIVTVTMQVGSTLSEWDGGYHYILLLDAETLETVDQVGSTGDAGIYAYCFSGLTYDTSYLLYAGTDPDNDGYICGEAEACGAYLSLDKPEPLTLLEDMADIDFTTDTRLQLSTNTLDTLPEEGLVLIGDGKETK